MSHYKIVCKCGDQLTALTQAKAKALADVELDKMFAHAKENGMSKACLQALKERHAYQIVEVK